MRNISSWAIRNPIFPLVLFAALTLLGLVSFMRMDVNDNPDIEFPAAVIIVSQPGAAPTEMETQVTQRIESAVRGVAGIEEINSSVGEGFSSQKVSVIARYPNTGVVASGWLKGEDLMAGRAAVVSVDTSPGRIVVFGLRPQHRAQTHATFPLLFNALYLATGESGGRSSTSQ